MIITYHGLESVKVQFGDTTLSFNPISKDSKHKQNKFGADITLITLNDPDMNGADSTSYGDKQSFIINGPGEYEVKGIFVRGYPSVSRYNSKSQKAEGSDAINTVYSVSIEGMNVCFLGALGADLAGDVREDLDGIDVLFVPIGGGGVLDSAAAEKLSVKLEPKIIIPIHWADAGEKDALKKFLKESGEEGVKPVDKLTLKKKDLEGKEGDVVVLSCGNS